jgi:hypothetical protein
MAGNFGGIVSLLVIFSIVVVISGWFVQMAGLSALQYNCNALVSRGGTIPFATYTQLPAGQTCGKNVVVAPMWNGAPGSQVHGIFRKHCNFELCGRLVTCIYIYALRKQHSILTWLLTDAGFLIRNNLQVAVVDLCVRVSCRYCSFLRNGNL